MPLLKSNRTENNGKLLRRPQRRQPEPLQQCLSPVSSPDNDIDEVDNQPQLTQRDAGAESHTQDAIVVCTVTNFCTLQTNFDNNGITFKCIVVC